MPECPTALGCPLIREWPSITECKHILLTWDPTQGCLASLECPCLALEVPEAHLAPLVAHLAPLAHQAPLVANLVP